MALCVEDGPRYVTLEGTAELVADRAEQEREVNELIAPRYIGQRLGRRRWEAIKGSDRIGIRMRIAQGARARPGVLSGPAPAGRCGRTRGSPACAP